MKELKNEIAFKLAYIVYAKSFEEIIEDCFKEEEQQAEKTRTINHIYKRIEKHFQNERV